MLVEQEMLCSKKDLEFPDERRGVCQKSNVESVTGQPGMENNVASWLFPRNYDIARSIYENQTPAGRPVTPTVNTVTKTRFPVDATSFGRDELHEWKTRVTLAGSLGDGTMFNNRTHWNMRCKFLEVGLRMSGLDTIRENPERIYEKPRGGFFIYIPIQRGRRKPSHIEEDADVFDRSQTNGCHGDLYKRQYEANPEIFLEKEVDIFPNQCGMRNGQMDIRSDVFGPFGVQRGSDSETRCRKVDEELVLEDVSDKDIVPETLVPSCRKLTCPANVINDIITPNGKKDCENNTDTEVDKFEEASVRLPWSKLQRLREIIVQFFSRLKRNSVTPVDI